MPDSKKSLENSSSGSVATRWRILIGAGILLLFLIWLGGTSILGMLVTLGVVLAVSAAFLWRKNRAEMRRVRGDLRPLEKS